ncbi:MAG: hypothetical protein OXN79_06515 [bacterium]|nr:hypothetical protein [bacterium]
MVATDRPEWPVSNVSDRPMEVFSMARRLDAGERARIEVVAALMGMSTPDSAERNTVSHLRRLGLIDEDGNLTSRGNKWRADLSYGEACQEILDEIYPDELGTLVDDDGSPDATKVKTWFGHQGYGDSNARQMSATYSTGSSRD